MKNGQCPKCSSSEIYHKLGGLADSGEVGVRMSWMSYLSLDIYICTDCGYVESYAVDKNEFSKLREKWDKVA
jgi:predicted nucleic-acid-binding Zn-ribbon protein